MIRTALIAASGLSAVVLAAAHLKTVETLFLSILGGGEYAFLFLHFRTPLFVALFVITAVSQMPHNSLNLVASLLRSGWKSEPRVVWRNGSFSRLSLHPEEIIIIVGLVVASISGAYVALDQFRQSYANYGLRYLALHSCLGHHDRVVSRAENLLESRLWNRYRSEIQLVKVRSKLMTDLQERFEQRFDQAIATVGQSEAQSRALEHAVLFGLDVREQAQLEARFGSVILESLNARGVDPNCGQKVG